MTVFSATGHRPNKLYDAYPERHGYDLLVSYAEYCLKLHEVSIIGTGMALGWDMAVAQACSNLLIPYVACIPFQGQECQWPKRSQEYYKFLVSLASQVVYVCDPGYAPWKMQRRNEYMVDNSVKQLALWNGTSGGTGNCVKYAKSKKVEVVNCWDGYVLGLKLMGIEFKGG